MISVSQKRLVRVQVLIIPAAPAAPGDSTWMLAEIAISGPIPRGGRSGLKVGSQGFLLAL